MKKYIKKITLSTHKKFEVKDLTEDVINAVNESKIRDGVVNIFAKHATCAIILNENESGLLKDYIRIIKELFVKKDYEHDRIDNNAHAHLASAFISQQKSYPIIKGEIKKGTWQDCLLLEFDGPRKNREIIIQVLGE